MSSDYEIFITHHSQDHDLAQWLYDVLDKVGCKPCLSSDNLISCKACVAFITPDSIHSSEVRREMAEARAHSIPVIPLVEQGVTSGRLKSPITYHPHELGQLAYNLIYRLREMIYGHEGTPRTEGAVCRRA